MMASKMRKIKKTLDRRGFMCYICGRNLHLMAKKKDKKEEQAIEPVANCDLKNTDIKALIRTVR